MTKTDLIIPELTDELRATFAAHLDEWTAIGRSTDPGDSEGVLAGMAKAYAAAKLDTPRVFFGISPIGAAIMRALKLVRPTRHGRHRRPHRRAHGANGIGPGTYRLHGKREQADEIRRVQD